GGVLVGAIPHPTESSPREYIAAADSLTSSEAIGVFPGGEISPGITVNTDMLTIIPSDSDEGLGSDVQAIAMDSNGDIFVVDMNLFRGVVIADDPDTGLGRDAVSLAVDSAGDFYGVDNHTFAAGQIIPNPYADPDNPNALPNLLNVQALASQADGTMYAVDMGARTLRQVYADGSTNLIGQLIDHIASARQYTEVRSLDLDSSETLYGLGKTTDDLGSETGSHQFLITINTTTAKVTRGQELDTEMAALAIDTADNFYGATAGSLYTIDTSDGTTTEIAAFTVAGDALTEDMEAITFIQDQLYGVTAGHLYAIDTATAVCTQLTEQEYPIGGLLSLAYDQTNSASLWATTVEDSQSNLVKIPLAATLTSVDDTTGSDALLDLLQDSTEQYTYINVHALTFDRSDTGDLYAIADSFDLYSATTTERVLLTIDESTGEVTEVVQLSGGVDLDSLAFDSSGPPSVLYGVNHATDSLVTVNTGTGATAAVGVLGLGADVEGIEFADIGSDYLFAVTGSNLYVVDKTDASSSLLGDTQQTVLSCLSYDETQAGLLWATTETTEVDQSLLIRINLSSTLVSTTEAGNPTVRVARLIDSAESTFGYDNVHALEFDGTTLYGIGTLVDINPLDATNPASTDPILITINTTDGTVTQIADISGDANDLSTLAFDGTDWFGVDPADDDLLDVNITTAATAALGTLTQTGIVGLDFVDSTLYAVTTDTLYTVNPATGDCTEVGPVGGIGTAMTSLTNDPNDTERLFSTSPDADGVYQLVKLFLDPDDVGYDFGKMIIGGTLSGEISTPKSIDVIEMGWLWGNVTVDDNLGDIILTHAGGAMPAGDDTYTPDNGSLVHVGGTLNMLDSRSGTLYTAVQVENDSDVDDPSSTLYELEVFPGGMNDAAIDAAWLDGDLIDYSNDSVQNAQFLAHPTGYFNLVGELPLVDDVLDTSDWYAFGLMAGQTIVIDGSLSGYAVLYDSDSYWMDSFGYETNEDWGVGSRGLTAKPITFTAPAAGVYYLEVVNPFSFGIDYQLSFSNGPHASLGGVNVVGDYDASYHDGTDWADGVNIATGNGGDLGAVVISNESLSTVAAAFGGGDLVAFQAGQLGHLEDGEYSASNQVTSEGNIGRVAATNTYIDATIEAGASGGFYNNNAYIQNISAVTDYITLNDISATGSIGVIEIGGDLMTGITITLNSDGVGSGGRSDLIHVGGDFVAPLLQHGPGGDFGYIYVGGTINVDYGSWIGSLEETTYSDGRTTILNDDGGGQLTISPAEIELGGLDEFGQPLVDHTTYSFSIIPVDDSEGGVGGVIANLSFNGSASLNATGMVQISDLDLDAAGSDTTIGIGGSGTVDIYYVHGGQIETFNNNTPGRLVSGSLGGIGDSSLHLAGDLGVWDYPGSTGAWLFGNDDAPTSAGITIEPQYGWFHGKINGLNVTGDLGSAWIGGSLGDLRVLGEIGTVRVNADGITQGGEWDDWDGINGLVWSQTRIGAIYVGDGLSDDGGSDLAMAAIMSSGSIGSVYISGPRYEQNAPSDAGLDETLKQPMVFGELNGSVFAMTNDSIEVISDWRWPNITESVEVDAINQVIGSNGAVNTALIGAVGLDSFHCFKGTFTNTASVGTVSFSGAGAEITGSEIFALDVGKVSTSADSNGINYSYISGVSAADDGLTIGQVLAGGPGMSNSSLSSNGGNIGSVKGVGPVADIRDSKFTSTDGMKYISARDINDNEFHMPGELEQMHASRDIFDNEISVGALGTFTAAGNFTDNEVTVAGVVKSIDVKGYFDSVLILQGPSTAYLQSLTVVGNIAGTITSAGKIGKIISKTGAITADTSTLLGGWDTDIELIETALGYTGTLDVDGSLGRFYSYVSLGDAPTAPAVAPQTFNIRGDLDYLKVGKGVTAHLYANLNVGGDVGTMDIDGTFYSNTNINGNLTKLTLDGALGGPIGGTDYGNLTVFGYIKSMKFNAASDLVADLTVGGSLSKLYMRGGSILGDITSLYGSLSYIYVMNGDIGGTLTAPSIGTVRVVNGSITADVTANDGGIKYLYVRGGDLDANVTAADGRIDSLYIYNGDATAGHTIEASAGFGRVSISNGDLDADLVSGGIIKSLIVRGSDLTGDVISDGEIWYMNIAGAIDNATVRSGGQIKRFYAGSLNAAIISSAWNIGTVLIKGNMANSSYLLAGYDVGEDGIIGTADDNLLNGGVGHSGNIKSLTIMGILDGTGGPTVIAAGIDPVGLGPADGQSDITRMFVRGGFLTPANIAVLADTGIYAPFVTLATAAGVTVVSGITTVLNGTGTDFGPDTASNTLTDGDLTLTLTGAGRANYNPATGALVLERTTSRSTLTLRYTGVGAYPTTIDITGSDDSGLAALRIMGNVTLGDVQIDGLVRTMTIVSVADDSTWSLPGGVTSAKLASLTGVDVTAGEVRTWTMTGAFNSTGFGGSFSADAVKSFRTTGDMQADLTTTLGDATTVYIRNGNLTGDLDIRGTLKTLTVTNGLSGQVDVGLGDIYTLKTGSLSGVVDVARGLSKNVTITTGDFSGTFDSAMGISKFTVSRGNFSGALSTRGDLRTLSAARGEMSGQAWSGGSIRTAKFLSMDSGFVAASADLYTVTIRGDMLSSWLFAGFDPGDDLAIGGAGDDADAPLGGTIKRVTIYGDMGLSTISGAVGPGADGYVGTGDDVVAGTGYVYRVTVYGRIYGNSNEDQAYGVYAASNMPIVYQYRNQPFIQNQNARVDTMASMAGNLNVTDLSITYNSLIVDFNHPLNFDTIDATTFTLLVSVDSDFATLADNTDITTGGLSTTTYDSDDYAVTLTLVGDTWNTLGLGDYYQLTIDGETAVDPEVVTDLRASMLDGEFSGTYPSGNGSPGGDFVWEGFLADVDDDFEDALDVGSLVVLDGGTLLFGSAFESTSDVDIYGFSGIAADYFAVEYLTGPMAKLALFFQDDQGTLADTTDDFFEAVARYENMELSTDTIFQAFELPETGDYYLAVVANSDTGTYQLEMTMSSSDTNLVADLGGSLPTGEEIAYVSNNIGDNNNNLGANDPKQLVYLNFDGGTTTDFTDSSYVGFEVTVEAFDSSLLDAAVAGYEDTLINGGTVDSTTITGIVDNIISIFQNTAASHPAGALTVNEIDVSNPVDWATYTAATEGLWFTTVDPATAQGLDPTADFTTIFIGRETVLSGTTGLGLASSIDFANLDKADNALVFAQNFAGMSLAGNTTDKLNEYSRAFANTTAHELGHVLGLNHQPTDFVTYALLADDPDNNDLTADDSNTGVGLMAYKPNPQRTGELNELGTATLTSTEFPVGWIDTQDLLLRWLA
ncbi:MAG: hypothetical protein GWP14_02195, partial [Actinobacteria bacterium]|nr:hypothetical protein [Actinomycetota bacterium]